MSNRQHGSRSEAPSVWVEDDITDDEPFSVISVPPRTMDDRLDFYETYREVSGGDTYEPLESLYQARLAARAALVQSGTVLDRPTAC